MKIKTQLDIAIVSVKNLFVGVTLFSIFANLLMLTGPLFMLQVYDRVLASGSVETLTALFLLITGLFLIFGLLDYIRGRVMARAGARIETLMSDRVDEIALMLPKQNQDILPGQGPSELAALRKAISSPAPIVFMDIPWAPVFLLAMFVFHPVLGYFGLVGGLIMISVTLLNHYGSKEIQKEAVALEQQAERLSNQSIYNNEVITSMGMNAAVIKRVQAARIWATQRLLKASDKSAAYSSGSKSFRFYLQSAILAGGAYLAINGDITPGAMIAASILMGRALAPVEQGIAQWPTILRGTSAYKNLQNLLETYPTEPERTLLPKPKADLKVRNLTVTAPASDKLTLVGVNFEIEAGEVLGVLGKSASGKSTLTKALTNIWRPSAGSVKLGGADLFQWPSEELGKFIGYLPQDISLLDGTVSENIARMQGETPSELIIKAAKKAGAHEMILSLPDGYETQIGDAGSFLSGGQRQRIGLARALFGDPVLVVLDEPNAHLDADGEIALVDAVKRLKDQNKSVVVAAHRPNVVAICDKILVLENGRVSAIGPREEFLSEMTNTKKLQPRKSNVVHKLTRLKA